MNAKEYLMQYSAANRRVSAAQEHLAHLREIAQKTTPHYGETGGRSSESDRLGAAVARIVDAESRLDAEISALLALKAEIEGTIGKVENERLRVILYRRYILGEKWHQIADALYLSDDRWVRRLHKRALCELESKLTLESPP